MTENQPGHREPGKPHRRRKKHEGATWSIDSKSALAEDGIWCPHHRMRHGYKSSLLGFTPERWNGKSYIHWYCKTTGDVLETVELNARDHQDVDDEHEPTGSTDAQDRGADDAGV